MKLYRNLFLLPLALGTLLLASCRSTSTETPVPFPPIPVGGKPTFTLQLAPSASPHSLTLQRRVGTLDAFVDLNGNKLMDAGEAFSETPTTITIPAGTTSLDLYGAYEELNLQGLPVEQLYGDGLDSLYRLNLTGTALRGVELQRVLRSLPKGQAAGATVTIEEQRLNATLTALLSERGIRALRPTGTAINLQEQVLILRLPQGLDFSTIAYEVGGAFVWLDKNLNGVQDEDEAITARGRFTLPVNAAGESVYIFHGQISGLSVYRPDDPSGDEEEEEEEEEVPTDDEGEAGEGEARAFRQALTSAQVVTLDASRARGLLIIEWGEELSLGAVDVSGCEQLRSIVAPRNPVASLTLPTKSALRILQISGHRLPELDLRAQPLLQRVSLPQGLLKEVQLGTHAELSILSLGGNQIESLSLPELPALKTLTLERNKLHSLLFPLDYRFENLETVSLADNSLSNLILRGLVKTKLIDVSRNPLITIALPQDLKELRVASTNLTGLHLNPQSTSGRSFIQKLDASDCPHLRILEASQCSLLTEVNLAGSPRLTPEALTSSLPKLTAGGKLRYSAALTAEQRAALSAHGWTVQP